MATGWKLFDCKRIPQYGYGRLANVFTNMEFERLCNAAGPTNGKIVLRDGKTEPKSVAIIHCVGSRDANYNAYCSAICCMAALKFGHLVLEKTKAEVYSFYIDMRTNQKDYEEFYQRLLEEGMHFVRGKVAEVTDAARLPGEEGKLIVQVEDTLVGKQRRIPVDMVILMGALEPQADAKEMGLKCGISCSMAGWYTERHPKLDPVATMTDGVFVAGACQGPKDIPASVAQGAAAAARVQGMITKGKVMIEPIVASIDEANCSGCRICNNMCPYNAIEFDADEERQPRADGPVQGCGTCVAACPAGVITRGPLQQPADLRRNRGRRCGMRRQPTESSTAPRQSPRQLIRLVRSMAFDERRQFRTENRRFLLQLVFLPGGRPGRHGPHQIRPQRPHHPRDVQRRVDPTFVLKALSLGADGVHDRRLPSGRVPLLSSRTTRPCAATTCCGTRCGRMGVEDDRVQLVWASAAEGQQLAEAIDRMVDEVKTAGSAGLVRRTGRRTAQRLQALEDIAQGTRRGDGGPV